MSFLCVFLQVKMGLLVDLTNTTRFYDRNDIEKERIKYVKLQCKGYDEIHCHNNNNNSHCFSRPKAP